VMLFSDAGKAVRFEEQTCGRWDARRAACAA